MFLGENSNFSVPWEKVRVNSRKRLKVTSNAEEKFSSNDWICLQSNNMEFSLIGVEKVIEKINNSILGTEYNSSATMQVRVEI